MYNFCDLRNQKICLKIKKSAKAGSTLQQRGRVPTRGEVVTFKFSLIFKVKVLLEIYYCKTALILI